jgi:hypothetical protein
MDVPLAERPVDPCAGAAPEAPVTPSHTNGNAITQVASNPSEPASIPKATNFSWLEPHLELIVILVGPDEIPFGLQKDFLYAKSSY